ncbi:hypothetical protein F2Q68_00044883 [Brassica cretica]|uniref:Uncharacterized protein n=1 Tax=Brassica cretica TaxID=69181 RepID=A0A8S9LQF9_BRACR|nr:hypothetical protein F2Q68_00044883 [Brassica cretica]
MDVMPRILSCIILSPFVMKWARRDFSGFEQPGANSLWDAKVDCASVLVYSSEAKSEEHVGKLALTYLA